MRYWKKTSLMFPLEAADGCHRAAPSKWKYCLVGLHLELSFARKNFEGKIQSLFLNPFENHLSVFDLLRWMCLVSQRAAFVVFVAVAVVTASLADVVDFGLIGLDIVLPLAR